MTKDLYILRFVAAILLSYIVSYVSVMLAIDFPSLRFYGKWIALFAFFLIFVNHLLKPLRITTIPGFSLASVFLIYILAHDIVFPSYYLSQNYGFSIIFIYFMYIIFRVIVQNLYEYRILIRILWMSMLFSLFYYMTSLFLFTDGNIFLGYRISSEDMGAEININTISFMAVIWLIITIRMFEVEALFGNRNLKKILIFSAFFISFLIVVYHASLMATLIWLTCLIYFFFKSSKVSKTMILITIVSLVFGAWFIDVLAQHWIVIDARIDSSGSTIGRMDKIITVLDQFSKSPIFGMSVDQALFDNSNISQHTFLINILTIYGLFGFIIFIMFIWQLIKQTISQVTPSQVMAVAFFVGVWLTAPTNNLQIVALVIMISKFPHPDSDIN
jgi:hypothetical protein